INGHPASRASRRAISVLPTPVGPIIRIFLGRTSSAISGGSFCRRTRLRRATATARFAAACPTIYLSSSTTISRGVMSSSAGSISPSSAGRAPFPPGNRVISLSVLIAMNDSLLGPEEPIPAFPLDLFYGKVCVAVNANFAGDAHGLERKVLDGQLRVLQQSARGCQCVNSAGTDRAQAVIRFDHVAISGKNEGSLGIGHNQQSFQVAQCAVLAPFLGQFNGAFLQVSRMLLQLAFKPFEKRNRIRG